MKRVELDSGEESFSVRDDTAYMYGMCALALATAAKPIPLDRRASAT